ncbi:hypothetical protein G4B88_022051 [Cannabis sativa]|uniref:GHMP kinase N-terminal domain-containing protein n=1 Tax=Cannabis sativa TaxID=3483 RepID=A0A7J6FUJ0_CANSA|nr:hypothetical protein G4B88_022051 [Cannabis sativa]
MQKFWHETFVVPFKFKGRPLTPIQEPRHSILMSLFCSSADHLLNETLVSPVPGINQFPISTKFSTSVSSSSIPIIQSAASIVTPISYPKSLVLSQILTDPPSFDRRVYILVDGTVPTGSGLSSSAAFVCSSTIAIMAAFHVNFPKDMLKKQKMTKKKH